jgi:AcrR family transcriptional regulator
MSGEAVLDAADRLFYERGIGGVGMDDIRDAAGVSLRRLYSLHPSKRDLVAAWLDDRHGRWMAWFDAAVERHVAAGVEPLLAPFDAINEWVHSPGYRGCAFINAIAETSEIDDSHRAIIAAHKRDLLQHVRLLATRSTRILPEWVPDAVAVLIDGAIVQTAIYGDDSPIAPARAAAAQLLKAAP